MCGEIERQNGRREIKVGDYASIRLTATDDLVQSIAKVIILYI